MIEEAELRKKEMLIEQICSKTLHGDFKQVQKGFFKPAAIQILL
jgi:hypothetical protein